MVYKVYFTRQNGKSSQITITGADACFELVKSLLDADVIITRIEKVIPS